MPIKLDEAKQEFRRLEIEKRGTEEFRAFLLRLREQADLTPDDMGWVLWNICDQFALAKDAITQQKYQAQLFDFVRCNFPERAHWVVSDGTQADTLFHAGFRDFWWNCYQFANDNAPRGAENRGARLEAHRTSAGQYTLFGEIDRARFALDAMTSLLEEDSQWECREFASATHKMLLVQFYAATGEQDKLEEMVENLERELNDWLTRTGETTLVNPKERFLLGSWQHLNAACWPTERLPVSMANAACEFAHCGLFPAAERLFRIHLQQFGGECGDYCQCIFLLSCWRNTQSKKDVIRLLDQLKMVSLDNLRNWVPELVDIVTELRPDFR